MLNVVRIIPVTIVAALVLLGVKVGDVWSGVREAVLLSPVTLPATGQAAIAAAGTAASAAQPGTVGVTAEADLTADETARRLVLPSQARAADGADREGGRALVVASAAQAQEAPAPDAGGGEAAVPAEPTGQPAPPVEQAGSGSTATAPTEFSQAEIELLQNLSRRRDELDAREQQNELRENVLAATEKRIEERIGELRRIESQIDSLLVKYDAQRQRQVDSLVRIYQTMKAKDAARIFERLDMNVLLEVAENMNSRALAPILAEMDANRAQKITVELATRRQLPGEN